MVDTLPRPDVSAERYRELEAIAMQIMLLCPSDLGEVLIVRDLCTNILVRWVKDERLACHEKAARQGTPLLAEGDNIIHLPRADRP